MSERSFDLIIVGGGPAGLSAALIAGRMRRRTLILDTGAPANAVSHAMHAFLAQDGVPPSEVRRIAAEQLEPYDRVERRAAAAVSARRTDGGFEVGLEDGSTAQGRFVLLAHGMRYGLPGLDGVPELWGERIFHCPYCHGWEVRDHPIAVLATSERAVHQTLLLGSLSDEVVLLAGAAELTGEERDRLAASGVEVIDDAVERLTPSEAGLSVEFAGGRDALDRHALFIQPDLSLPSDLAASLGAAITERGSIETDPAGQTTVPGLYAAGDAAAEVQSVAVATGTGARAAYAINAELAMEASER